VFVSHQERDSQSDDWSNNFRQYAWAPFFLEKTKPAAERSKPTGNYMKNQFVWAGALALAIGAASQVATYAAYTNANGTVITNGTIIVTTRAANDGHFFLQSSSSIDDMDDNRGSGTSPGDVAMCELLQDNGYSTKLLPDKALNYYANPFAAQAPCLNVYGVANDPSVYWDGNKGPAGQGTYNELLSAMLVVISGSGSSSDAIQPNTNGVPIVCGESAILGSSDLGIPNCKGELFMYTHKTSNNYTSANPTNGDLYMKVLLPNHPIMQGIPLVSIPGDTNLSYVQILRSPYPNENSHVLTPGGLPNYQVSTCYADIAAGASVPAPGLQILGVLASHTNYSIFAVMEAGGVLGDTTQDPLSPWLNYTNAPARMVHFFVNEQGSGNTRRSFNALSVWGRILFVRCCQWAMSENLAPFQGLGVIKISQLSPATIKLSWTGSSQNNYRVYGSTDVTAPLSQWVPVADSIVPDGSGNAATTLSIASAPQAVFMQVATLPWVHYP
jgi:hypothetical protein